MVGSGGGGRDFAFSSVTCSHESMSNRFAHLADQEPVVEDGIEYWESQPASLDGVLGEHLPHNLLLLEYLRSLRGSRRIWDWCRSIFSSLQDRCYGSLRVHVKVSPTN
jgi:hypothetical protein